VDCVFINSSHVDAPRWREKTWTMLEARFREQIATTVPAGASFTLIDDGTLGIEELSGRRALPFLERDGEYWGAPEDGEQAVAELSEVAARGVHHVVVAWPSFWWLEEYPELERHLRSHWQCVAESEAAVVFERQVS
jgi:hypothetical protein